MQKKRIILQGLSCLMLFIMLYSLIAPVSAENATADYSPPSVEEATAVWLYHMESDSLLVSKNADFSINAGSTVKVMAGLLACERLVDRLNEEVVITSQMLTGGRDFKDIQVGDVLTVEQLLYIALCGSYNNVYNILACYISGSIEDYTNEMNLRTVELGTTNTLFTDASGIDDSSRTTVSDMAKIASAAYQNPLYIEITSTSRYFCAATSQMKAFTVSNYNALIYSSTTTQYYNKKCRGMHAGSTQRGGNCVVTVATDGIDSYLCVIMGATDTDTQNLGYVVANRLINWGFATYTHMEVISPETVVCTLPVTVSDMTNEVQVRVKESFSCYLPKGLKLGEDITYSVRLLYPSLEAPVSEGIMVGYVAIMYQGKAIDTVPIYTAGTAERSSFISSLKSIQVLTQNRVFRAGAIFFLVVLIGWILTEYILFQRRRHKWDKYFSMKMNPSPNFSDHKTKTHKNSDKY